MILFVGGGAVYRVTIMGKHITILDEHMCVKEKNNTNNLKPINISCGYQKKGNSWLVKVIFCYLKFKKISCGLVANSVIFLTMRVTKFGKKSHLSNVIVFLWVQISEFYGSVGKTHFEATIITFYWKK